MQSLRIHSFVIGVVVSALPALAGAQPVALAPGAEGRPTLAPLLREVTPAVVNISVASSRPVAQNPLLQDPFFRRFFELPDTPPSTVPSQSVGSGVIIDAERGYVVTNHHVVADAEEITVTLTDRRRLDATLVGSDPPTDVALLRIDASDLHAIPLGDSDNLEVGDFVVAIGNPFGLGQTVTSGIVSALGRSGLSVEGYEDFIQTDASINPGNSGGALIDLAGELVGINTAILTPAGGNVGIGFAIPADMVQQVVSQLTEFGEVRRGRLGISIQTLTPELAEALDLQVNEGVVVTQVEPGSAAESAGVEANDVIIAFNGEPVTGSGDLRNKVGLAPVGTTARLTLISDGERQTLDVPIRATAEAATAPAPGGGGSAAVEQLEGVQLSNLGPEHPLAGRVQGVLVTNVEPGSAAQRSGLAEGDVITAVNRTPIASVAELRQALEEAGTPLALNVRRDDAQIFVVIR